MRAEPRSTASPTLATMSRPTPTNRTRGYACWRRRIFDPGCRFSVTHVRSQQIRVQQRFQMFLVGSVGIGSLDQFDFGSNSVGWIGGGTPRNPTYDLWYLLFVAEVFGLLNGRVACKFNEERAVSWSCRTGLAATMARSTCASPSTAR